MNGVLIINEGPKGTGTPFEERHNQTLLKIMQRGSMNAVDFAFAHVDEIESAVRQHQPRSIVALRATYYDRLIHELPHNIFDSRGYVFWSGRFNCWMLPTVHPNFIVRGKTAWSQVIIHDLQRGVEIAEGGYKEVDHNYELDCEPLYAHRWVDEFEAFYAENPDLYLSTDIETPGKDADEEGLDLEDSIDYLLLRCGYSYKTGHALSIPWDGPYRQVHERLLRHASQKLFWNGSFDVPRLRATGLEVNGPLHDAMDAWHVLNSDLKKSLGFVTPFFYHGQPMWKHLSNERPAYYNAVDADAAGVNMRGTVELLKKHGIWKVYEDYVISLDPVFSAMSRAGMPVDRAKRIESSKLLISRRASVRAKIEEVIPEAVKTFTPKNGYVRVPKSTAGLSEVIFNGIRKQACSICGEESPKKAHFKSRTRKLCGVCGGGWTKTHVKHRKVATGCEDAPVLLREDNVCKEGTIVERIEGEKRWAKVNPFVASTAGILRYQRYHKHPAIMTGKGKDKKPTTNEKAINKLIGKYPTNPFYPLVLEDRELTKLGGTYIGWYNESEHRIDGGFPMGRDGRVHGHFRNSPSTLRTSMVAPNLQNLPRGNDSDVQKMVKQMFVAPPGYVFIERDFSGIEAVLVGYHAGSRDYMRLAKMDVHSYFSAFNLYRLGVLTSADLPDLGWSDQDLSGYLKSIKKRFADHRNDIGKRCVHSGNYRVGPKTLHEQFPTTFNRIRDAAMALGLYYEVFPAIEKWHERICLQVDKSVVIRNSFGLPHRFYSVINWSKEADGKWDWDYGEDSKRLIAFDPQSDAAFIGRRTAKNLYYNYPDSVAKWLRLFIHDSFMLECPINRADEADEILKLEMEKPVLEMPLDVSWGFGTHMMIDTEGKRGESWGSM